MSRARRLRALECLLGRPAAVTWQEAYAADDRIRERLYAKVTAMAVGQPPAPDADADDEADGEVLRRWRRQRGIPKSDPDEVGAGLLKQLERIERSLTREASWAFPEARAAVVDAIRVDPR